MSVQATFCATLVDEWVHLGVTDVVVCPGSRSTPLALPLAQRLRTHVRLDERSAAFYALGLAKATARPVVVCVTSGTAAAELHPAVVEAHHARVPLIVCTADRPPELHHTGASQTIEQDAVFSAEARWSADPGVPAAGEESTWRPLAGRAYAESVYGRSGPGPVHLNLAFREPLTDAPDGLPARRGPDSAPAEHRSAAPAPQGRLEGRGIVVVGGPSYGAVDPEQVLALATRLGWPVFADPLSRCRVEGTIAAADAIVRTSPALPEVVVQLGAPWLSKALGTYMTEAAAAGRENRGGGPVAAAARPTGGGDRVRPLRTQRLVGGDDRRGKSDRSPRGSSSWRAMEARGAGGHRGVLATDLNEPQAARTLFRYAASADVSVFVSASMPIRDLEWYAPAFPAPPEVMANRGANGIDGVVSSALGVAAAGAPRRTLALLGDLAFLHDVSGLVNLPAVPCTFVVVDNDGGGIFSFLPQATTLGADVFEPLFGTPPTSDVGAVARGFGLPVEEVTKLSELEPALAAAPAVPALIRVAVPARSAERRGARRDQPGGPSRAAPLKAGEGVEVVSLPVGLRKVSSTLASPDSFQPISWTKRWCWSHSSTRLHRSVAPPFVQCSTWCTSVNSVWVQPGNRQPLSRRRISMRWASEGSRRVRPRLRLCPPDPSADTRTLASQASRRATSRDTGPSTSSSAPPSPPARKLRSAWTTTVGRLRRMPPARGVSSPSAAAPEPSLSRLQRATSASAMRWSKGVRSFSRRLAPSDERALDHGVVVFGQDARQHPATVVEAEEAPGVGARGLAVGLLAGWRWRTHAPAWPTSASPARPAGRRSRAWPPRRAA